MSYTTKLIAAGKLHPPKWMENNIMFEGLTGSVAYGCSNDTSDMDVIGFCIPPKDVIFPHLRGEIPGFGTPGERFEQFQEHGVHDETISVKLAKLQLPDTISKFDVEQEMKRRKLFE